MSPGKFILICLISAVCVHLAVILSAPRLLMNGAMDRISAQRNIWRHEERASETARALFRPTTDVALSRCVYDLSHGPVRISAERWRDYASLTLYGANSDSFFTLSDREAPDGFDITIVRAGRAPPEHASQVAYSPSTRGVAILRRLAPTTNRFAAAELARQSDRCSGL